MAFLTLNLWIAKRHVGLVSHSQSTTPYCGRVQRAACLSQLMGKETQESQGCVEQSTPGQLEVREESLHRPIDSEELAAAVYFL